MGKLDGKVALITGAGQGIGQGIAHALAKEGVSIAVAGRTESKLVTTVEQIEAYGGKALPVRCDVSDAADSEAAVERTVGFFGGVDILVNNANDCGPGPLLSVKDEDFERSFATGPLATLRLMRACYPSIKEGMRSLTRAAACEWGIDGIRVNSIAPHAMSPALEGWIERFPEEAEAFKAGIPLRRIGDAESDIGRAVVFLVGDDAGYLTGATIPLDGGQSRWG
jgi:NAD(P)-dependent dehydrogenase (short-subunit alcohol dehydrogenase family)